MVKVKQFGLTGNLTPKEEMFCQHVLNGESYSDAYRKAYRPVTKYNHVVHRSAQLVANNPRVRARVAKLMELRDSRLTLNPDKMKDAILNKLFEIGMDDQHPKQVQALIAAGKATDVGLYRKDPEDIVDKLPEHLIEKRLAQTIQRIRQRQNSAIATIDHDESLPSEAGAVLASPDDS